MTSPGVEHTLAGHERQESKDTQATLNDGIDATPNDNCRTRKRAASDGSDAVDDAHEAKRFRVAAETSAAPPAATTTAQITGLPTAAAPQNISMYTTAAPAAVDPHDDDETSEPDEVLSEDEVNDAAQAQGDGRDTSPTAYDDDDVVPPTCVWTTLEPAAIAYGIIPNYVDDNQTPWRLTVIPLPRGARRTEQRVNPWLPSCVWVRLGPAHFRYEHDPDWVDDDGGAWRLVLIAPPMRGGGDVPPFTAAAATSEDEDETSDDASSGSEQVPFEECDCCCCRGCCCCCRGCWCCELATSDGELTTSDDELTTSDDAPAGVVYTWTRLGPAFLGFDRYADVVDRNGVAWRRDLLPPPCTDVEEEASSSSEEEGPVSSSEDEGAQEAVQRSDADIGDNDVDDVFEDAGAIEDTDEENDGSDGGVDYDDEDEDELEYAD